MEYIEIDQIDIEPDQNVRQVDKDKEEFRELIASIKKHGVLQPVGIYKKGARSNSKYGLIFGFRRVAAAREAGLKVIPYSLLFGGDGASRKLKAIIENIHREDMGLAAEANSVKVLMEEFGMDRYRVKDELNKSIGWVDQRIHFFKMDESVQERIATGKLNVTSMRELSGLSKEEQKIVVEDAEKEAGESKTVQRNVIRAAKNRRRKALMSQQVDVPEIRRIQEEQKKQAVDLFCSEVHYGQIVPEDARRFLGDFYDFLFEKKKIRII